MKKFFTLLVIFSPIWTFAQENIGPATMRTELAVKKKKSSKEHYFHKSGESLSLPFIDDFSKDHFPGNEEGNTIFWENSYAQRGFGLPVNPPTLGAVSFDGTDELGFAYDFDAGSEPADTLTSCPIDLTYAPGDGVGMSFYFQPQGKAPVPGNSSTDSLILEFYAPQLDTWFWAWSSVDLSNPGEFDFVYIPITQTRYLMDGFKFRFRNIAPLQGVFSVWNVDYIWLDINNSNAQDFNNDVAIVNPIYTLLEDYSAMPLSHFAVDPQAWMRTEIEVLFRNLNNTPRTLVDNEIRVFEGGDLLQSFPNPSSPAIDAGQTLLYTHSIAGPPNNFVYDPTLQEEELVFNVEVLHGTPDFELTQSNDTLHLKQEFYTHYAYDDGSAEASYRVNNPGSEMALRYFSTVSDSIWALEIYIMPQVVDVENTNFTIRIWEENNGVPGDILGEAIHLINYGEDEYQDKVIYKFEEPVFVPAGNFFVGFRQSSQEEVHVGLDLNTSGNNGRLYYDDGDGWLLTGAAAQASLMIHPMFTTDGYQIIASNKTEQGLDFNLWPNPASNWIEFSLQSEADVTVGIYDLSGRMVQSERLGDKRRIDISQLAHGMYLVRLSDQKGNFSAKRLIIGR